ncbi:MAG: hypothetical protein NVS2B8_07960 [Vulcanimicrobiaceae bacterium]
MALRVAKVCTLPLGIGLGALGALSGKTTVLVVVFPAFVALDDRPPLALADGDVLATAPVGPPLAKGLALAAVALAVAPGLALAFALAVPDATALALGLALRLGTATGDGAAAMTVARVFWRFDGRACPRAGALAAIVGVGLGLGVGEPSAIATP